MNTSSRCVLCLECQNPVLMKGRGIGLCCVTLCQMSARMRYPIKKGKVYHDPKGQFILMSQTLLKRSPTKTKKCRSGCCISTWANRRLSSMFTWHWTFWHRRTMSTELFYKTAERHYRGEDIFSLAPPIFPESKHLFLYAFMLLEIRC